MSHECLLAYPNRADECTLAGGSWSPSLPLTNLQTTVYQQFARTVDALEASTQFTAQLAQLRPVRVVALDYHNISVEGQYRIRLYEDATMTTLVDDSGVLDVFDVIYTEDILDWDSGEFFDGRISEEDRASMRTMLVHVYDRQLYAGFVKVEIFDEGNADGYVQAGRLFIASAFVPAVNMDEGAAFGYEARDEIDETHGGAEYTNARPGRRVVNITLSLLSEVEGMRVFDMQRLLGSAGELLFMYDRQDTLHLLRRAFIGRMRRLSPIESIAYDTTSTVFEIQEKL